MGECDGDERFANSPTPPVGIDVERVELSDRLGVDILVARRTGAGEARDRPLGFRDDEHVTWRQVGEVGARPRELLTRGGLVIRLVARDLTKRRLPRTEANVLDRLCITDARRSYHDAHDRDPRTVGAASPPLGSRKIRTVSPLCARPSPSSRMPSFSATRSEGMFAGRT